MQSIQSSLVVLIVCALLVTISEHAGAAGEARIWTPTELVHEGGLKLCKQTEIIVELRVTAIRRVMEVSVDGKRHEVFNLVPAKESDQFEGFSVRIEPGLLTALALDGVTDLESHYVNNKLKIRGKLAAIPLDLIGRETVYSYYINLGDRDQILAEEPLKIKPAEAHGGDPS